MQSLTIPVVVIIGLMQIFATVDALIHLVGLAGLFAYPLALLVDWTPIIGAAAGVAGTALVWDGGWLYASLLLIGPFLATVIIPFVTALLDR